MATAPAIMPNAADAASALPFVKAVTARLATATAGAAENRPENSLGSTASPTNENATTSVPPANAFRHTIQRSLTCSPVPGAAQRHAAGSRPISTAPTPNRGDDQYQHHRQRHQETRRGPHMPGQEGHEQNDQGSH